MEPLTTARVPMPQVPPRPGKIYREELAATIRRQHKRGEFAAAQFPSESTDSAGERKISDLTQPWRQRSDVSATKGTLVPRRAVYRVCFTVREKEHLVKTAREFGLAASEWVSGLGRGAFGLPFHRMGMVVENGPKTANVKISIWDDEYEELITRFRMAQPLLICGSSPIAWYEYFRLAALGRITAPIVRGEHRDRVFPPDDLPLLRSVHSLIMAARSTWPSPKILPQLQAAQKRFLNDLWVHGWQGTNDDFEMFNRFTERLWDWKREGPIEYSTWAHCLAALERLGRGSV